MLVLLVGRCKLTLLLLSECLLTVAMTKHRQTSGLHVLGAAYKAAWLAK
jgi:hypothetical protein